MKCPKCGCNLIEQPALFGGNGVWLTCIKCGYMKWKEGI